jgi:hypothetical protein
MLRLANLRFTYRCLLCRIPIYLLDTSHDVFIGSETFRRVFISALLFLIVNLASRGSDVNVTYIRVLSSFRLGPLSLTGIRLTCSRALRSPPL